MLVVAQAWQFYSLTKSGSGDSVSLSLVLSAPGAVHPFHVPLLGPRPGLQSFCAKGPLTAKSKSQTVLFFAKRDRHPLVLLQLGRADVNAEGEGPEAL